jgi:hypothetical protein
LHSCSDEPRTGGAAIVGQQHPGDKDRKSKRNTSIQDRLQHQDHRLHCTDKRDSGLGGFLAFGIGMLESLTLIRLRFFVITLLLGLPTL